MSIRAWQHCLSVDSHLNAKQNILFPLQSSIQRMEMDLFILRMWMHHQGLKMVRTRRLEAQLESTCSSSYVQRNGDDFQWNFQRRLKEWLLPHSMWIVIASALKWKFSCDCHLAFLTPVCVPFDPFFVQVVFPCVRIVKDCIQKGIILFMPDWGHFFPF